MDDTGAAVATEGRLSRLERGERATSDDIRYLRDKLDEVSAQIAELRAVLAQRRGAERMTAWIFDTARLLAAAVAGAWASHRFGGVL